jgi:hypothetical protein
MVIYSCAINTPWSFPSWHFGDVEMKELGNLKIRKRIRASMKVSEKKKMEGIEETY